MTTRDVIDQLAEMLLAGSETTSGTLCCLFMELARNPDVRAKLLATLPPLSLADGIISSKTIRNMNLGTSTWKRVSRRTFASTPSRPRWDGKCPDFLLWESNSSRDPMTAPRNTQRHKTDPNCRSCTGDQWVNLMGYDLPPHTVVSASYRHLHHSEEFWPQAQRFWPERWLPPAKRGNDVPAPEYLTLALPSTFPCNPTKPTPAWTPIIRSQQACMRVLESSESQPFAACHQGYLS